MSSSDATISSVDSGKLAEDLKNAADSGASDVSSTDASTASPGDGADSGKGKSGIVAWAKSNKVLVGILILIILIGVGVGIYFLVKKVKSSFVEGAAAAVAMSSADAGQIPPALMNQRWVFIGSESCPACRKQKEELSDQEKQALYLCLDNDATGFFHAGLRYKGRPAVEAVPTWAKFPDGWSLPRIRALQRAWSDMPPELRDEERRALMQQLVVDLEDLRVGWQSREAIEAFLH